MFYLQLGLQRSPKEVQLRGLVLALHQCTNRVRIRSLMIVLSHYRMVSRHPLVYKLIKSLVRIQIIVKKLKSRKKKSFH